MVSKGMGGEGATRELAESRLRECGEGGEQEYKGNCGRRKQEGDVADRVTRHQAD